MRIKLKNVRPLARRGKRAGDEDDLLAYLMNSNNTVYSPTGGYNVQFAPTAENRDYQAVGLPAAQIVGQSPNPQARYVNQVANQISQQQGVGNNNDYFRTVGILNNIMKDKKYVGKDGALNQQGWAKLAQDQMFGPGSDWYKRHNQSAKDIASGLAQVAMLPYAAGMGGLELLGSVGGGALGATIGSNIGQNFDNPYSGNYAGSELGGLFGGLVGGAAGANIKGLGRAYIRGMNNLMNKQDLYWASRGYKLNGSQPNATEINKTFSLNTTPRVLNYNNPIKSSSSNPRISLKFLERPSKLTDTEKMGIPKGQSRLEHDPNVLKNAEAFAKKYGYDVPTSVEEAKNMYRRHNRFFRTITLNEYPEGDLFFDNITNKNIYPELKGLTNKEAAMLLASKGYPLYYRTLDYGDLGKGFTDEFVFASPSLAANESYQTNGLNQTVMLQRPFSFGSPNKWHLNADYNVSDIASGAYTKGDVGFGNASPIHEVKLATDKLIPVKMAEEGDLGSNIGVKYETNNLNDVIFRRKYGGRAKFPDGGGLVDYVNQYEHLSPVEKRRQRNMRVGDRLADMNNRIYQSIVNAGIPISPTVVIQPEEQERNNVLVARRNRPRVTTYTGEGLIDYVNSHPHLSPVEQRRQRNNQSYETIGQTLNNIQTSIANLKNNLSFYSSNDSSAKSNIVDNTSKTVKAKAPAKSVTQIATNDTVKAKQVAKEPANKPESPAKAVTESNKTQQATNKGTSLSTKYTTSDTASIPKNEDYTVVRGDSPWKIADKAGITINTLYELNPGMEKRGVYVGDRVNLTHNITSDQQIEKVTKRGDSPWAIAHRYGMTLDEFYKLNPNAKSRGVYIGDEFVVNKNRSQKKYGGAIRRRLESGGQLSY